MVTVVAWLVALLISSGLAWLGFRAWHLAWWGPHQRAQYRPDPAQIATRAAADAYAAHHPRLHSVRFQRRPSPH